MPATATRRARLRAAWPLRRVLVVLVALAGCAVLLYPTTAVWFSDRAHAHVVSGWAKQVKEMPTAQQQAALAAARRYNAELPPRPLADPYSDTAAGAPADAQRRYERLLDTVSGGVMGVLRIPKIDVDLPIYHGTSDEVLSKGVGHLFGSTLPVGGPRTHAVLTGHSGFVNATLFDHLHELVLGDEFEIDVDGRVLVYRVDDIRTVLPDDTQSLQRVPGKDYVTLVTCTPIGVNTHRLLVRGVRVPNASALPAAHATSMLGTPAGFPWWLLEGIGAVLAVLLLTRRLRGVVTESSDA